MINPITYEDLRALILQQGIAPRANIYMSAHLRKTLYYTYGDLEELAGLIHERFNISLNKEQISGLDTIHGTLELLNILKASGMGTTSMYEALLFELDENE